MKNQTLKMNSLEFKMMSETHLKVLAMQGIEIVINDLVDNTTSNKVAYTKKVDNKVVENANKVSKASTKGKKSTKGRKTTKDKKLIFGKVKVGGFAKCINKKDDKVVYVGKIKSIDLNDNTVDFTSGKKWAKENCVAIGETEFKRLKKSLKIKDSTNWLAPKDYKAIYAYNLFKLGKITEDDFTKANADENYSTELYQKFKTEVKLNNAEAMKILAENSAKANA